MIDEIDRRLKNWAEGVYGGAHAGLGHSSTMGNIVDGCLARSTVQEQFISDEVWDTDRAVARLQQQAPHLHAVVRMHYQVHDLSVEQKAKRCRVGRMTYYRHLDKAHQVVLAFLRPPTKGVGPAAMALMAKHKQKSKKNSV